jgi:protein TonB
LSADDGGVILSSKGAEKRLLYHVPPALPKGATAQELEGTVILKTMVDDTGKVESVHLVEGNPALADAAIQAVKQWRYRPYVRDGKSLPFQTVVLVDFQRP